MAFQMYQMNLIYNPDITTVPPMQFTNWDGTFRFRALRGGYRISERGRSG